VSRYGWGLPLVPLLLAAFIMLGGCAPPMGDVEIVPTDDVIYMDGAMDYCADNWRVDPNCWDYIDE